MKPSNNLENKTPSDNYSRVQLVCEKVQAHSSLETLLEFNQDQMLLTNLRFVKTFSTILGVTEILCIFRLVEEGKTGKEIPKLSRLEFSEKFSAINFTLSDAEVNTSGPMNRGGIANLPLFRTLLVIH